jgi:hypothetical protein
MEDMAAILVDVISDESLDITTNDRLQHTSDGSLGRQAETHRLLPYRQLSDQNKKIDMDTRLMFLVPSSVAGVQCHHSAICDCSD